MIPLLIDNDVKSEIKRVKKYAEEHVMNEHMMKLLKYGDIKPVGDNPDYMLRIHDGFRVIYSIEQHHVGKEFYHHLSISVETRWRMPNEPAVNIILEEFGMKDLFQSDSIYTEEIAEGVKAVNIIQEKK